MKKLIDANKAGELIDDDMTIGLTCSFIGGFAEDIAVEVEKRFLEKNSPKNLTIIHATGSGDYKGMGTDHFGYKGMTKRLICSHTSAAPKLAKLVENNEIECYFFPQGVITQYWRAIASNKPVLSKVGLKTFVDPRYEGGKVTSITKEDLVHLTELNGDEWLNFTTTPIDIGLIRGTYSDEKGNICMKKEAVLLEQYDLAMAVKNSGGIVIAQVEKIVENSTINAKDVFVPAAFVDYVVIGTPQGQRQTIEEAYNPVLSGEIKIPLNSLINKKGNEVDVRKLIARRCALELTNKSIVNLGIGIPQIVAEVALEEGIYEDIVLTTEIGGFGGIPGTGFYFGTTYNAEATFEMSKMFDFYDGGGLDTAVLGFAQVDETGNVNVSKFGKKVAGPGGFINISQNTNKVVFCGTFIYGSKQEILNGRLVTNQEGKTSKFVKSVDQITFNGDHAKTLKQTILYVTERCVFSLVEGEMVLIEIAEGIDIDKDIISLMGFKPKIAKNIKKMNTEMFKDTWGKLNCK